MNRLSLELLRQIALHVEPQSRAAFRNINQYTRGGLDYHFLFHSVTLTTLEQVQYFGIHPHFAGFVINLVFLQLVENLINRREFLRIFPNAQMIRVERAQGRQRNMLWLEDIEDAVRARPQIVYDFHHCDLVHQIISNHLGNNITMLDVDFDLVLSSGETMSSFNNMPRLLTVHLRRPRFELAQLEEMHRNCDTIQTLTLDEARILQVAQPRYIPTYDPVHLLNLTLSFHHNTGENAVGYMCQYVRQKYQHLQHINFSEHWYGDRDINQVISILRREYGGFLEFVNRIQNPMQ